MTQTQHAVPVAAEIKRVQVEDRVTGFHQVFDSAQLAAEFLGIPLERVTYAMQHCFGHLMADHFDTVVTEV